MSDSYTQYTALKIDRKDHVLTITIDNPPFNAMSGEAHKELTTIWSDAAADPDVRVIVFTGAGDRVFSAGGDLNKMIDNWGDRENWQAGMAEAESIIINMLECPKPVISRINGHAMGLGATLALCGDITIIVDEAKIGDTHVKVGLATGDGGALLWPHLMGLVGARKHLLTGDPLSGTEAAAAGLVTASVSRAGLDEAVADWATKLSCLSPSAVQASKCTLNLSIVEQARRFMGEMLRLETQSWESPNHPEAVKAILEKREPKFVGD